MQKQTADNFMMLVYLTLES